MQELSRTGSNNPAFMLDEVDKIGVDSRGDPASALLEVLDTEQIFSFVDLTLMSLLIFRMCYSSQ